jgi:Kef-type K+ transport system membrane component KefB
MADDDERERTERQLAELLQELRVALPGVQILFAFLLTVPFAQGFQRVTNFQKDLFFATLMCTAVSTACLIAPTATHRLRFHKRDRKYVIEAAHRLTIAGLVFLALAMVCAVALITDFLFDGTARWIWPILIAVVIAVFWFIRPLARSDSSGP